ncbi:MAG: hypothetical protein SOT71_08110 [Romboutsia timonensis]|uniref:hypothetical protein n=1 Tax=Romboutsia timonensis TaxID=1776391 RepID=UPI002A74E403|nr:hypothetical protein [Romboutsia timonensis]MDY2882602.1 hypothetical protein [Romboutsia timonensis]
MIEEKDIVVREFKGADAPLMLNIVSDLIFALWINPASNMKPMIEDPKEFFAKKLEGDTDALVEDMLLFTKLSPDYVKVIASFALNEKTNTEYSYIINSVSIDEFFIVAKKVLLTFINKFNSTVFFSSLKNRLIYTKNT